MSLRFARYSSSCIYVSLCVCAILGPYSAHLPSPDSLPHTFLPRTLNSAHLPSPDSSSAHLPSVGQSLPLFPLLPAEKMDSLVIAHAEVATVGEIGEVVEVVEVAEVAEVAEDAEDAEVAKAGGAGHALPTDPSINVTAKPIEEQLTKTMSCLQETIASTQSSNGMIMDKLSSLIVNQASRIETNEKSIHDHEKKLDALQQSMDNMSNKMALQSFVQSKTVNQLKRIYVDVSGETFNGPHYPKMQKWCPKLAPHVDALKAKNLL